LARLPELGLAELRQQWRALYKSDAPPHLSRELLLRVERVIVDEKRIVVAMRRSAFSDGEVPLQPSNSSGSAIELAAAVEFKRRGAAIKIGAAGSGVASECALKA
jgi:hypothetical protein